MSEQAVRVAAHPDPYGRRAAAVRVLANAFLILLAYEIVAMASAILTILSGTTPPLSPVELVPLLAAFLLIRWIFVLPGLLLVLVGIEYVARRVAHARALTAIVAFVPMILWELTNTPGDFPSADGALLGVTALVFAVLARLPARDQRRSTEDGGAALRPVEPAAAPR